MKYTNFKRKVFSLILVELLILSVLVVLVPQIKPVYATEIFSDGFERNFDEWNSTTGDPVIVEDPVYSGTYSMESAGGAQSYATKTGFSESEVYIRLYYRTPASLTDAKNKNFLEMNCDVIGTAVRFGINNNGGTWRWRLRWWDGSLQSAVYSSQQTPVASTWYCAETHFVKGVSDTEYHIYVNGVELSDIAKTGCANNNNMNFIKVGDNYVDQSEYSVVHVDCVVVADTYIGLEEEQYVFSDGFESGKFDVWNGTTESEGCTADVGSNKVREGTYSAEFTTDAAYKSANCYVSGLSENVVYFRNYIAVPSIANTKMYYVGYLYGTSDTMYRLYVRNNAGNYQWGIRWYDGSLQAVDWSTQHNPEVGEYYHVEMYFKRGNGNGEVKLFVADTELTDVYHSSLTCDNAITKCSIGISSDSTTYGGTFYVDASAINSSYVGDTLALPNPITFSDFTKNSTVATLTSQLSFYATCSLNNLSHYIISTNNTESWVNGTAIAFSGGIQEGWANDTIVLNSAGKQTIQVRCYANNTDGYWSKSSIESFKTFTFSSSSLIHVTDTKFFNSTDDEYYLAGVHWADLVDDEDFYYGMGEEHWIVNMSIRTAGAKEIGANHVRISIQLENFINPYTYTGDHVYDDYANVLDNAIQCLIDNDMYAYICFHYGSSAHNDFMEALIWNDPWNYTAKNYLGEEQGRYESPAVRSDWLDWCAEIAFHYKDVPNVLGYQIWAEPAWGRFQGDRTSANYDILFKDWWEFNNDTILALQAGNPDEISWVVNCGHYITGYMTPNHWDGRHGAEYGTLPYDNVVYSIQKYESEDWRGGSLQQQYSDAYEDWYNGLGDLDTARELQEDWYWYFCFNFSSTQNVPVFNTEFAYCDDMEWNYKDGVNWTWQREQAQGFYDIWKNYSQGWTQHRWQIGQEYGGGSPWGFFKSMDDPNVGDYELAPSGELMMQTLHNIGYKNLVYPYVFSTTHLLNITYANNVMNLTVNMTSTIYSIYSITKVYCGAKGEPEVTGEESYSYDAGTTILSINATHSSVANLGIYWEAVYHYLNITAATGGTTNPTAGVYPYLSGTYAEVEATASEGYEFANWTLDGGDGGSTNPTYVMMNSNHTLTPNLDEQNYTLTIGSASGGSCNLTVGEHSYGAGATVKVYATADSGYSFSNWTLDGGDGGTDNPVSVSMNSNHTLTPVFVAESNNRGGGPRYDEESENETVFVSDVVGGGFLGFVLADWLWLSIFAVFSVLCCVAFLVHKRNDWR